jgi:hypothetical protein
MTRCALLILLVLYGCSSRLPVITSEQTHRAGSRWPGVTSLTLNEGRQKYIEKCASCHSLYVPSHFTEEQWTRTMKDMRVKAHLTQEENDLIVKFIFATRME